MTGERLREQILSAFPPELFTGSVTSGCTCDECAGLAAKLRHQSWITISDEVIEAEFGSLPLLSEEAFRAFLPTWLTQSLLRLEDKEQKVRAWTLYKLALYLDPATDTPQEVAGEKQRLRHLYERLGPEQVCAVEQWLQFLGEHANLCN